MKKVCKRWKFWGLMLGLMLFAAGFAMHSTTVETQAAVNGFRTVNGKTYYYKNGKKLTGTRKINNKYYYFDPGKGGAMLKGWYKNRSNQRRYFDPKTGVMRTGLRPISGKYYYFDAKTGWAQKGFKKINGHTRYFSPSNYTMAKGWMKNSKGQKWYFDAKNGIMKTGLKSVGGRYYYFDPKTGGAKQGFIKFNVGTRYFIGGGNYRMATGWHTSPNGQKRYFDPKTGIMSKAKTKVSGKWYYFSKVDGVAKGGWLNESGRKRYFDPKTLVMVTGTCVIDNVKYTFNSSGLLISSEPMADNSTAAPTTPTSARTMKNYLLNAMQPVGRTLYIWGGGHNTTDATRKGISTRWTSFYESQSNKYDYDNYRYETEKGLDCSGYVGWTTYQIMHSESGVGSGYSVVSGEIGGLYKSNNWGTILNQNYLSQNGYKLYPGDIGYNEDHTWIILGQCSDKSAVILHSTPNAGVQISGTPVPGRQPNYNSQAIALAEKYMSRFPGYKKMGADFYHTSSGNYVQRGSYFRWNSKTLSDPNGYRYKTADQILADLFS
nr:cell wall-binding protein [uncultured Blautia sp.]